MGVDFTGDWEKVLKKLDTAANKVKRGVSRTLRKELLDVESVVLGHMDDQDLGWNKTAPLNKEYAKRKEAAQSPKLSPDILRATNRMYKNITTHQQDDFTGSVGVKRGVKNKDGEDVTDVALIHEQPDDDGTIIPARKLWEPTFNEVKGHVAAEIQNTAIKVFK